jgi:folate-binding protein YgfZ
MFLNNTTTTFNDQYTALRTGRGLVELPGWSSVTLTGADRQAFLHNFCTNDIKRLVPGQNCETFFTNVKGKILGHGLVTCRNDELVIIGVPGQAPRLMEHLDRYVIREDVQLRDTTAERRFVLIAGEGLVRDYFSQFRPDGSTPAIACRFYSWNLLGTDFAGLLELRPEELATVLAGLTEIGIVRVDRPAFNAARIEAGVPLFGVDFDDRNFPQEVGRNEQAISFNKGCYLGQETVARIDALGHVNQQLAGVRFAGDQPPEIGTELTHAGHAVGHVTSATYSPRLQAPLALAILRREHAAVGTHLDSPAGECYVLTLPL